MTNVVTKTAPRIIFLCISDDEVDNDAPYPGGFDDITWSTDQPVDCTVKYVRADLYDALKALLERAPEVIVEGRIGDAFIAQIDALLKGDDGPKGDDTPPGPGLF
jgi:hypothetical protein